MVRNVPLPGQAAMPASDAAALIRQNGTDPVQSARPAIRFGEDVWTHGQFLAESTRLADLMVSLRSERAPTERPLHLAVLLDNTPDYLFALGGAALSGSTIVGLNPTRTGEHLQRDLEHTDVDAVLTEPGHLDDLAGLELGGRPVIVSHRFDGVGGSAGEDLDDAVSAAAGRLAKVEPEVDASTRWVLIFTSGTSGAPKAVICTQRRLLVTGNRMVAMLGIEADDVGYIAMPLFHSNSLMVGWAPSLVAGASVGLARKFSVSGFLPDVRRYGSTWFNYTGKPLSYLVASPEQPDDADNPLRVAFGNEGAPAVLQEFARRFGVEVIDAFGSTEGAVAVDREEDQPPGAMGRARPGLKIVDEDGVECPPARFAPDGTLLNPAECVGEIVNTEGRGPFEGYYNNDAATAKATRNGWYWSGDLGYLDEDRYLYFAGRTAEWIRVDGENFPAGPIADAISLHPDVVVASVYGVPDATAGDQVMVAIVLREGTAFDPAAFAGWLDEGAGIGPKWRPRYVRVAAELPTTGTNKIVTRVLARERFHLEEVGTDELWVRPKGSPEFVPFTRSDEAALRAEFDAAGRTRFWTL